MGVTHHSNYIRWMEEARIDFLRQIGWEFARLEEEGIVSPVIALDCRLKAPTTFSDEVLIVVEVEEFRGVKLKLKYTMKTPEGASVCTGHTEHGFLNTEGRPIRMKKEFPELFEALSSLVSRGD